MRILVKEPCPVSYEAKIGDDHYQVNTATLTSNEKDKLAEVLSQREGRPYQEVREKLGRIGEP